MRQQDIGLVIRSVRAAAHRATVGLALLVALALGGACDGDHDDDPERERAGEDRRAHDERGARGHDETELDPRRITPRVIALGDSIFHGMIGAASCQACHGPGGAGGPAAPSLADAEWLHSDGSLEAIYNTIRTGVFAPKQFTSVMLPNGGVALTPEQTRAVAAYVYSLRSR